MLSATFQRLFTRCAALLLVTPGANASVQVLFGNCDDVIDHTVCVVPDSSQITLWIRPQPGERVVVHDQRGPLEIVRRSAIDGGTRYEVLLHDRSHRVDVVREDAPGDVLWSLSLARRDRQPDLERVKQLFGQRRYEECETLLQSLLADRAFSRPGGALRLAGIFYHNRGQPERARDYYRRAIAQLLASGRVLEAVRAASAMAYLLQHTLRDFAGARAALTAVEPTPSWPAEAQFFAAYDRALLGFNSGEPRIALAGFDDAARLARRLGDAGRWQQRRVDAEVLLASQLQRMGRRDDARAIFDAWHNRDLTVLAACDRARFQSNAAWSQLLILEAGDTGPNPSSMLDAVVSDMRMHCGASDNVTLHIHRALAHWHAGRLDAAELALADAQAATDRPELRLRFWELEIAARIAAARGRRDVALATLAAMERLAGATLSPDARWRAAARRGDVLEQFGRVEDALAAYARADAVLREDLARVPLSSGLGPFNATRDWATRRQLALLIDRGAHARAARLVRAASLRSSLVSAATRIVDSDQVLARLSAARLAISEDLGAGWRVPSDELAVLEARRAEREASLARDLDSALGARAHTVEVDVTVAAADAQLAMYPAVDAWVVVVWRSSGPHVLPFACPTSDANGLAQCALDAAAKALAGARRLVILDGSALAQADVAALMLDGEPVVAKRRVVYSAGQPGDSLVRVDHARFGVVGDPTRQLPRSRAEAQAVLDQARRRQPDAIGLNGRDATFVAVRDQLDTVDVWHFAGHADTVAAQRWRHALALARGETLSVADVLALPRSPTFVVLSACGTSGAAAMDRDGATGLAQAFLVAGADAVLATSRAVDDADAQRLVHAFYANWTATTPADAALAIAQRSLADGATDWSAFRLLTH